VATIDIGRKLGAVPPFRGAVSVSPVSPSVIPSPFTDHFSDPGEAGGPVCVSLGVSGQLTVEVDDL